MHPAAWDALDYKESTVIFLSEISAAFMGCRASRSECGTHCLQSVPADASSEDHKTSALILMTCLSTVL